MSRPCILLGCARRDPGLTISPFRIACDDTRRSRNHESGADPNAMTPGDWQAIGQCVQAAAAILALPYIALQVRHARAEARHQRDQAEARAGIDSEQLSHQVAAIEASTRAAEAAVYQGFNELMMRIDLCFVEHPELRPFFYGGLDLEGDRLAEQRTEQQVMAMAETFRDLEDHVARCQLFLGVEVFRGWQRYFSHIREHSPAFKQFCHETGAWYAEGEFGTANDRKDC